jgi:hypothetical protein
MGDTPMRLKPRNKRTSSALQWTKNGFVKVRLEFTDGSPYEWFELQEYIREIAREELEKAKNAE